MIEIDGVTKNHYRGTTCIPVLRGVTCQIPQGAFTFILGPSGSGKSTLLYLLGALDEPTAGEIRIAGRKLSELPATEKDRYRREDVGFIFQSFNLLSNLDAVDNVLVPSLPSGRSRTQRGRAIELLQQVGLSHRLDHKPSQLSGGEQQRVAIARALLKQPKVILADEPTGELDSVTGAEIFAHLRRLQQHGATIVTVTHDERYLQPGDLVLRIADGVIVSSNLQPSVA